MKLLKKLLPVATVATTAVCVVPMVTSCSKAYMSTTDIEYKSIEHTQVELADEKAVIDEYFKNPKYFASDALADMAEEGARFKESVIEEFKEGYTFSFNAAVSSLNIKESKTITISETPVYGYVFDAKISLAAHASGEVKKIEEPTITKITGSETATIVYEMCNCFAILKKTDTGWETRIGTYKDASDSWSTFVQLLTSGEEEDTYKDGKVIQTTVPTVVTDEEYESCKNGDNDGIVIEFDATSFAKVTAKA